MSSLKISFADAVTRFPGAVDQAVAAFKASRSKYRNVVDAKDLSWKLVWYTKISGPISKLSAAEERTEEQCSRTFVVLQCSVNSRSLGYSSELLLVVPEEIRSKILKHYTEDIAEEQRIASLSREERQEELDALLQKFLKQPGAMMLRIL